MTRFHSLRDSDTCADLLIAYTLTAARANERHMWNESEIPRKTTLSQQFTAQAGALGQLGNHTFE